MTATQDATTPTTASWPPGLPRSLDYPEVPVGSILRAAVRRWGDRPAFIDHDVPLTFEELGAHDRAGGGPDDEIRATEVGAGLGQPGEEADLPGDAGDAAPAEDEGGALVAHGDILTYRRDLDRACELSHAVCRRSTTRGCA